MPPCSTHDGIVMPTAWKGVPQDGGSNSGDSNSSSQGSLSAAGASLRTTIKACNTRNELLSLWRSQQRSFNSGHLDSWLRRVPSVLRNRPLWTDREILAAYEEVVSRLLSRADSETWHFSGLIWSAAKVSYTGLPSIKQQAEARLLSGGRDLEPIDICLTLWAYSQRNTGRPAPGVLDQLIIALRRREADFEPMGVATSLWSLAKMGALDHFRAAEEILRPAAVRFCLEGLMEAQNISNILWAYGSCGLKPQPAVLHPLLECLQSLAARGEFEGQAVANSLWALAKLSLAVEFKTVELALRPKLARPAIEQVLKPLELSNVLWAFGALRIRPERPVLRSILDSVALRPEAWNQNDVAFLLGALARLGLVPEFTEAEAAIRPVLLQDYMISSLQPHATSNILQGFGELSIEPDPSVVAALSMAILKKASEFRPQDTAQCLLSFAELGLCPSSTVNVALLQNVVQNCGSCTHRHAANLCWAIAILSRCLLPTTGPAAMTTTPWLQMAIEALSRRLAELSGGNFTDEELSQVYQAHLLLRSNPGCQLRLPSALLARSEQAWRQQVDTNCRTSELQLDVARSLQSLGIEPELKACTDDGLFRVQLAIRQVKLAVEVAGPYRFTSNSSRVTGPTIARSLLLQERGWIVLCVPFFEWDELRADPDKQAYLTMAIQRAFSSAPSHTHTELSATRDHVHAPLPVHGPHMHHAAGDPSGLMHLGYGGMAHVRGMSGMNSSQHIPQHSYSHGHLNAAAAAAVAAANASHLWAMPQHPVVQPGYPMGPTTAADLQGLVDGFGQFGFDQRSGSLVPAADPGLGSGSAMGSGSGRGSGSSGRPSSGLYGFN